MNINELLEELTKRNIALSGRAISKIWGMDETSFSKKKKAGTQIKQKNVIQLEAALGIKLFQNKNDENTNTLERQFDKNIETKRKNCGIRILEIKNKNNLSDIQMAGILNVSVNDLMKIITGEIQPNIEMLDNIKQNFKVSIDWLLYGE